MRVRAGTSVILPMFFAEIVTAGVGPALDRAFPQADLSYIVMDVRSQEVIAQRWADADVAIPVGSLVKPFTALAYSGAYPELECTGAAGHCWRRQGHGRLQFADALAQSCNAYFLQLAARVSPNALAAVAAAYGIPAASADSAEARIGLQDGWRVSPLALIRAYSRLSLDASAGEIRRGLALAARSGTAATIKPSASEHLLAKTGTALCVAERRHAGDGFALLIDSAESPRTALLVRVHNVPGAEAAKTAARLWRWLRRGA